MGVVIEEFLGKSITLPEDRSYLAEEGLWVQETADGRLAVGLAEPTLVMFGSVRQSEGVVDEGERVEAGQTVCLALTGKLKYFSAPAAGIVTFAPDVEGLNQSPYETPIFFISDGSAPEGALTDAAGYARFLADSEGSRNPKGHKGGTSPMCKAVYSSIGEQKIS